MPNLKELSKKPARLTGGHRMCAGCGAPMVVNWVLKALKEEDKAVTCSATGCLEVSTCLYPYTAWKDSFIHSAFENAAATISGVEACYVAMKRNGKIDDTYKFIAFGGDGGTYDIGLQSLSGAMERGHDMVYVCYDNGAYMNTGIQRSSATPKGADTTTSPAGKVIPGKTQTRKDLTEIIAAHNIPYVAQTVPAIPGTKYMFDLYNKAEKAIYTKGAAFLNVLTPCPRGWRCDTSTELDLIKAAVDTCFWPIYEVENGVYKLNYKPAEKKPITEWLKPQGRFRHLFKPENEHLIAEIQAEVDRRWEALLHLCGEK
ncbi:pyruvate ferredoxin oxidoreductase subunit beta [Fervidicella metallireducens AeB]|uniref:Pyruvate ferredoxin oxidoreductase subunit beta n=1 Tax=Fervidicella metallireducens AeB TaxID=1403537 RepID=A0A017RUJ1_9CLOT|nr:thiamine pyrophosphate-dependent enzyme [Fervidicella metallireducens]EYE88059.1 pyruvate ferredoxin oxidoreductase subunit beta [Fervidicella metallireducens AeB]